MTRWRMELCKSVVWRWGDAIEVAVFGRVSVGPAQRIRFPPRPLGRDRPLPSPSLLLILILYSYSAPRIILQLRMTTPVPLDSPSSYTSFLSSHDSFLFDCDGVIWNGDTPIPGVVETLAYLRKEGKKVIFVTNNATKSRKDFKGKFERLGIEAHMVPPLSLSSTLFLGG